MADPEAKRPRPGLLGSAFTVVLLAAASFGCAEPAARITHRCEARAESVQIGDLSSEGGHQIAVADGRVLLASHERGTQEWSAQWRGVSDGRALSDRYSLGVGFAHRPVLVPSPAGPRGVLMADVSAAEVTEESASRMPALWRFPTAGGPPERTGLGLDVPDACLACIHQSLHGAVPGYHGAFPVVELAGRTLAVLSTIPSECVTSRRLGNLQRMRIVDLDDLSESGIFWGDEPCRVLPGDLAAGTAWPVALSDGRRMGVFFASGISGVPPIREYMIVEADGTVVFGPIDVGTTMERFPALDYGQGRAVRLGTSLIFAEYLRRGDICSGLRIMNEEGTNVRDTPWQLPCRSDDLLWVSWVELRAFGDHALVVWSEHADPFDAPAWSERVMLALLDDRGRLASEPLEVTPPGASALRNGAIDRETGALVNPLFSRAYRTSVWVDDESNAYVSYGSDSDEHLGVFVRHVECEPLP